MKLLMLVSLLMFSSLALAESVTCDDDKRIWSVSFELDGEVAKNIVFQKDGEVYREFGDVNTNQTRLRIPFTNRGVIYYEINLGGAKYIDFERSFRGAEIQSEFPATFLLASHPFTFEKHVVCSVN